MSVDRKNTKTAEPNATAEPEVLPAPAGSGSPETRRSRNRLRALLHGVDSNVPVIPGMEDEDDYTRHRDGIIESLQPEGYLEQCLAERIAILFWKLRRVMRYEVAATMAHIEKTVEDMTIANAYSHGLLGSGEKVPPPDPDRLKEKRELRVLPPEEKAERITRQERHIHRQWVQTLHELQALQAQRQGNPAPMVRVDLAASPSA